MSKGESIDIEYSGQRYEATVPDTLDLVERAELAINGLGGTTNRTDYLGCFQVVLNRQPPYMRRHGADVTCTPKYAKSFPMMRMMCGSDRYADLEVAQRASLLARIEDGLYWNRYDPARPWGTSYITEFDGERRPEDVSNAGGTAVMMQTLIAWYELEPKSIWETYIRELVGGLRRIAIDREDYSYYPDGGFGEPFNYPRSGWLRTDEPQSETEGAEGSVVGFHGHQIKALARWYEISGDAATLDLAARLTRFCMLPRFWGGLADPAGREGPAGHVAHHVPARQPDPACISGDEQGHWYTHFHARAIALRGLLEYGIAAADSRVLEFVQRAYEYTMTLGIPRIGWVNCFPVTINKCEGCALGDLVALGIRMTDAGMGDYWDAVDAVVRNHLVEQQFTRADLLETMAAASPPRGPEELSHYPNQEIYDEVIARGLGIFSGESWPTGLQGTVMSCCTGNGTQGLYYAWEGIVREDGDMAQVNLLLNRAAGLLDIDSFLPYEGKVIIRNKAARRIAVRIPSWAMCRELRAEVGGAPRPLVRVGNYLLFDDLKPGHVLTITFPIAEATARYTVNARTSMEQTYSCTFRGSTLVDISPRDTSPTTYPIYLRDHMRKDETPMKTVRRYVPDKTISGW